MEKPLLGQRFADSVLAAAPFVANNAEVGIPLPGRRCEVIAPAVPSLTSSLRIPECQVVRNTFKGFSVGHCYRAKRSPLRCANRFSALDRKHADDDEVWYSASFDVEEGREQFGTYLFTGRRFWCA
eukprot:2022614-Amphidinium_carterae.1